MVSFSKLRDEVDGDIGEQIAALRKEVASLSKVLGNHGSRAISDASDSVSDMFHDVLDNTKDARKEIARKARKVNDAARENPMLTAVVGAAAIGLFLAMFINRR